MTTIETRKPASATTAFVAPWPHTVLLVVIFLLLATGGIIFHRYRPPVPAVDQEHQSSIPFYLSAIASEWLLFRAIKAGTQSMGTSWRDLAGPAAFTWSGLLPDVTLALAVVAAWIAFLVPLSSANRQTGSAGTVGFLLPRGILEIVLWAGLSVSAGICEELAFRGYFQKQFTAWTNMRGLGLILQAVLFGVAHAYQGLSGCIAIAAYGIVLGGLAIWRRNLRAAMLAHVFSDLAVGFFA